MEAVTNEKKDQTILMNVFFDVSPFKNFNYRLNTSYVSWNRERNSYSTGESFQGVRRTDGQGSGEIQFVRNKEWQVENIVTYNLDMGKNSLGFTLIQSASEKQYTSFIDEASYFSNDILGIYGLSSAEINVPRFSDVYKRRLLSFAGRATYDFDNKYYANVSIRADGSTVFGANNKWSYFPAVSVGWNVFKEDFIEDIETISNLKLRASYGSVGNEAIGPYQSQSIASQKDYLANGKKLTGYLPGNLLPNPSLRWETSTTLNVALDFGLWKNRLSGTFETYRTKTTDLLVDRALNAALGYTRMKSNIGEIQNRGIEFSLNGVIADKRDLTINAGLSFSRNKNEIVHLYGELDEDGNEMDDVGNGWFIGQPIDVYYQYKAVGIFTSEEEIANSHQPDAKPGDIKLFDRYPDDGNLNEDDRVMTKKDPDWFGSFNFEMTYKNFDLSADIITVQGITKNNEYLYTYASGGSLGGILNGIKQDYWTPENTSGKWPRPSEAVIPDNMNALGLQDASYIRLQTIELGYSLPTGKIWSGSRIDKLRFYCTGQSLLTLTDYESYSPEKQPNAYPEAISVILGLQLTF
ncbi:MAG: SusC/RagA family TonB-linked outer membrane protein [Draconibacterium sp.]